MARYYVRNPDNPQEWLLVGGNAKGAVLYNRPQTLSEEAKSVARDNIGSASKAIVGDLKKLNTSSKNDLVEAINEILRLVGTGVGGTVDPEQIERIVEDYLENNPPEDGQDGISATHSWEGTVLTMTSASGTSKVDLQGPKGDDGISPHIYLEQIDGGHRITIEDAFERKEFVIKNGSDGRDGDNGATPELKIGTVTTVSYGGEAKATITGTADKPVLNLWLPSGPAGSSSEGDDGREVVLRAYGGYIQWQYVGDTTWENIVALSEISGDDGVGIESVEQTTTSDEDGGTNKIVLRLSDGSETEISIKNGSAGTPGRTPVKGEDYFTDTEKQEIAEEASKLVTIDQVLPTQVVFPEGQTTNFAIGKVKLSNGSAELIPVGGTLQDFFDKLVEEKNPSTTQPKVTLTFDQAKAYEVGTKVTPTYKATLSAGSYTYGPATGVVASAWEVTDTQNAKRTTASGSFDEIQIVDDISYKITAKATHNAGAVPVTNQKNPYAAGQIKSGTKSATSGAMTGYRNVFYGTRTDKTDLTSDKIRALSGKSGKALSNGSTFVVDVPVGALRVVIAYPATLQDISSVKDVNGMNAEIASGFSMITLDVYGVDGYKAIPYKVYIMDFASANDTANTLAVTI